MGVLVRLDGREITAILPVHKGIMGRIVFNSVPVHMVLMVPVMLLMDIVIVNQDSLVNYVKMVRTQKLFAFDIMQALIYVLFHNCLIDEC